MCEAKSAANDFKAFLNMKKSYYLNICIAIFCFVAANASQTTQSLTNTLIVFRLFVRSSCAFFLRHLASVFLLASKKFFNESKQPAAHLYNHFWTQRWAEKSRISIHVEVYRKNSTFFNVQTTKRLKF